MSEGPPTYLFISLSIHLSTHSSATYSSEHFSPLFNHPFIIYLSVHEPTQSLMHPITHGCPCVCTVHFLYYFIYTLSNCLSMHLSICPLMYHVLHLAASNKFTRSPPCPSIHLTTYSYMHLLIHHSCTYHVSYPSIFTLIHSCINSSIHRCELLVEHCTPCIT